MKQKQKIMQTLLFTAGIAGLIFTASCAKKENILIIETPPTENPQGGSGSQGNQSEKPLKVPGKGDALIYLAKGTPSTSLGKTGDLYIDKATGKLYGPKQSSKWGTAYDMVGSEPGDDAVNAVLHAGGGTPGAGTGKVGDYFMNITNGDLFGPKKANNWGTPINISGKAATVTASIGITWEGPAYMKVEDIVIPSPVLNALGITNAREMIEKNGGKLVAHLVKGNANQTLHALPYSTTSGGVSFEYTLTFTGNNNLRLRVRADRGDLPTTATGSDIKLQLVLSKK